jgi:hypothetical protein
MCVYGQSGGFAPHAYFTSAGGLSDFKYSMTAKISPSQSFTLF